ncbi:MAG: CARDB domain-containing protein [Thermoleophilia bacterium]|nr:hypothetical protein [Gaiellaceae bacterium]MDW8338541.1 CARDB domain-containing protein [Thermoleophilia bacterium]
MPTRWCSSAIGSFAALLALLAFAGLAPASVASSGQAVAEPEEFGFGATPASGVRPLLVLLVEFSDARFAPEHTPAYYRDLFFPSGRLIGNVFGRGGLFDEMSGRTFYYESAGVLGPYTHPDNPGTPQDESRFPCANDAGGSGCMGNRPLLRSRGIEAAARAGFDFARFDTNGDRCVGVEELTILTIFSAPPAVPGARRGGQTDGAPRLVDVGRGLRTCSRVAGAGEAASAATFAHEVAHTLGAVDIYGSNGNRNVGYSLMAATITPTDDDRWTTHLDPFHKMRLGWLRPVVLTTEATGCFQVRAVELRPSGSTPQAYLVYDPDRGTDEFFLLEHRFPLPLNYHGDPFLRGAFTLPDQGLGIWWVKTGDDGLPLTIQSWRDRTGLDAAVYTLGSSRRPGFVPLDGVLWNEGDGDARPQWIATDGSGSGTESGLVVRVKSRDARVAELTIALGERDRVCARATRVRGPQPESLPAPGDRSCPLLRQLVRCLAQTPGLSLRLETPLTIPGGTAFDMRLSLTRTAGPSQALEVALCRPKGFQPLGPTRLSVRGLGAGKTVQRTLRLRAAQSGGRFPCLIRVRARGKVVASLLAPLVVSSEARPGEEPAPPPPPEQPPPPPPQVLPDLVVTALTATSVTVRNQGNAAAGPFVVRIQGAQTQHLSFGALGPGESATRTFAGVCAGPGATIVATADVFGAVAESDEGNNSRSATC